MFLKGKTEWMITNAEFFVVLSRISTFCDLLKPYLTKPHKGPMFEYHI